MRFDKECQLSVAQAFSASAVSTNSYDKKTAAQDLSIGTKMALGVYPAVNSSGGASWSLQAIQADDAALSTNVNILASVTCLDADLKKGNEIGILIPGGKMNQEFLGFKAVPTGGTSPGVTLDVYFMPSSDLVGSFKSFPRVNGSDA